MHDPEPSPEARAQRAEIEALIPHRDPFLFVDRIVERGEDTLVTAWDVPTDLDCFRGHYPGQPVLPGVLISEFLFQSGAVLLFSLEPDFGGGAGVPVLARIERARFRRKAGPGSQLRAKVTLERSVSTARYMLGTASEDGRVVAELRFTLAFAADEAPPERKEKPSDLAGTTARLPR